jgi:penicillin-binding protein 2
VFTQVFANGGKLYKPHLILGDNKILKKDFVDPKYINLVKKGMEESCETGGVAWPFFNFKVKNPKLVIDDKNYFKDASSGASMVHVKIACKTGTAEIGDAETKPHSWITVFAPSVDPEIVVTVLVENGGEGSSVAGPVARDILRDYFERK